jgi:hypothetical protein
LRSKHLEKSAFFGDERCPAVDAGPDYKGISQAEMVGYDYKSAFFGDGLNPGNTP